MLKFFRRIRQNLLVENKFRKYTLYAIGEIFLVVIGILIALQINTWNEKRKSNLKELKILKDLKQTLILDYPLLERSIDGNTKSIESCQIILAALEENKPYHDSLNYHFENAHLWWRSLIDLSGYERAKSYGLDFINDDSIRQQLNFIYTISYDFENTLNHREELYYYYTASPILSRLFSSTEIALEPVRIEGNHKPLDFESLKNDNQYKTILRTSIGNRKKILTWVSIRLSFMRNLEKRLDTQIKNRE